MILTKALEEAARRSRIKVTPEDDTEAIFIVDAGDKALRLWGQSPGDRFIVQRWMDIPRGALVLACCVNGELQPNYPPFNKTSDAIQ